MAKTPDFKNLIAHDVPVDASETRVEEIDGATYKVFDCSKYIIFPQQNGEIEVSPLTFECQIVQSDPSMDVFDAFFNGGLVSKVVKRTTKPLKLSVAALPEPKPNDFCGGVGSFSVKAELLTSKLRVNEISTYRVTISGAGNLKLLLPPTLNFPETFDGEVFNKRALRNLVFNDVSKLKFLESLIHPYLTRRLLDSASEYNGRDIIFTDVALLYEMGWNQYFDKVVLADVDYEIQKERVMKRDGVSAEDFDKINNIQIKNENKKNLADIVVDTDKSLNILKKEMIEIVSGLEKG